MKSANTRKLLVTSLLAQVALAGSAYAGTTWDGGGGANTNINLADNWDGTAPGVVNALDGTTNATFGTGGSTVTMNVAARFGNLTFSRNDAAGFTVNGPSTLSVNQQTSGTGINLGVSDTAGNGTVTINSALQVNTDAGGTTRLLNIKNDEKDVSTGSLIINGNLSASTPANTYAIRAGGTGVTVINGTISNASVIQQVNSGTSSGKVIINGNQTLGNIGVQVSSSGGSTTSAYTIQMGNSTADIQSWGSSTVNLLGSIVVKSNATLTSSVSIATAAGSNGATMVVDGALSATTLSIGTTGVTGNLKVGGNASFSGNIAIGAAAGNKIVGNAATNGNLSLGGGSITSNVVIGGGSANENNLNLIKATGGNLTIAGAHTYTGSTAVNGGNLTLSSGATLGTSGIAVNNTGTLFVASTALTSGITVNNGGIANFSVTASSAPVVVNAGGTLTGEGGSGALSFGSGTSTFNFDATTPGAFTMASYTPNAGALVLLTPTGGTTNGTPYLVLTNTAGFGSLPGEFAASARGSLSLGGGNTTISFTPTAAASLLWKGNVNGNWDVVNTQNWTNNSNNGTADRFYASDAVTFDDTASTGTVAVTGSGASVGSLSFTNNSTLNYSVTGSGIISAGALTKSGNGSVAIGNTVTAAGVSVSGGSLSLNAATTLGASDITVGNGTLTLSAANTATGNITLNSGGTLNANIGSNATIGALGSFASGRTVTLNGGTLNYGGAGTISTENMNLSVTGDSVLGVTNAAATLRTGGTFSGTGNLTVTGPGILGLGKNSADATWGSGYSGNIVIANGAVVSLRNEQSLGNTSGNTTVQSGGTLMMDPFGQTAVSFGESIAFQGNSTLSNRYNGQASLSNTLTGAINTSGNLGVNTLSSSGTSATLNFNGAIGGAGGVTFGSALSFTGLNANGVVTLPGTYILNAANTYAGPTVVNSGSVTIANTGSLASGNALTVGAAGSVNFQNAGQTLGAVNNSNTLNFSANTGTVTLASLAGSGSTSFSSNASIGTISGGNNTITGTASITTLSGGNTTVGGVATIGTMSAGRANLNGATSTITTLNGGTVALGSSTVLTVNGGSFGGTLTGGSLLTSGNFTFAAGSSFSGNTTVSTGNKLVVNGTLSGSALNIASGATLAGNGTISATASFASGAKLAPGNSPGILSFGSSTDLTGVTTDMELAGTGGVAGTDFDKINVTGNLKYGGTLNIVSYNGFDFDVAGSYNLFDSTSVSGTFVNVNVGSVSLAGLLGVWTGSNLAGTYGYSFTESNGEFTVTAIPEPSAYAALAGFGVIGLAIYRRRRRQTVSK